MLLASGFIFLLACTHKPFVPVAVPADSTKKVVITPPDSTTVDSTVTYGDTSVCFQRDVMPIFTGSCAKAGCHDATTRADGYNLTSYSTILLKGLVKFSSGSSKLYTKCVSGKMPESPTPKLDSTQLSFIRRWIDKGAPDDTDCAVACDTTKFTFAAAIVPILSTYCYSCHASSAAASSGSGIVLDTYSGVVAQAQNGKLISDIDHSAGADFMPLGGYKLPDCQITQIKKWIEAGAPNN